LKTNPREKKPFENYLGFVKELNKKNATRAETSGSERQLQAVSSLPDLTNRKLKTEQKQHSPTQSKPDSSRNIRRGRHSQPFKAVTIAN